MRALLSLGVALALALAAPLAPRGASPALPAAHAAEGWRAEFEAICAKTQDAMALSTEELKELVRRADALLPQVERLADESERKVFTRRLLACRNLYAFMVETREKKP